MPMANSINVGFALAAVEGSVLLWKYTTSSSVSDDGEDLDGEFNEVSRSACTCCREAKSPRYGVHRAVCHLL